MGTWAAGNFENDAALDQLGEILDTLAGQINEFLEGDDFGIDEGFDEVMVNVDAIRLLSSTFNGAPPRPADISRWKKRVVKVFDQQIDDMDPEPGFKSARRAVIIDTFDQLVAHAEKFWKRGRGMK